MECILGADQKYTIKSQTKRHYQAEVHISMRSLDGTNCICSQALVVQQSVYCSSQTLVKLSWIFRVVMELVI
jgi:hypothetical protein